MQIKLKSYHKFWLILCLGLLPLGAQAQMQNFEVHYSNWWRTEPASLSVEGRLWSLQGVQLATRYQPWAASLSFYSGAQKDGDSIVGIQEQYQAGFTQVSIEKSVFGSKKVDLRAYFGGLVGLSQFLTQQSFAAGRESDSRTQSSAWALNAGGQLGLKLLLAQALITTELRLLQSQDWNPQVDVSFAASAGFSF